jgi:hypothetical protein
MKDRSVVIAGYHAYVSAEVEAELKRVIDLAEAKEFVNNKDVYMAFLPPIKDAPRKIEFIKTVRDKFGLGLKDSKDLVDSSPFQTLSDMWTAGFREGKKGMPF